MKIPFFLITLFGLVFTYCSPLQADKSPADMVLIPNGCFMMGSDKVIDYEEGRKNDRERPVHKVCLDAFYLDKYEATQEKYEKITGETPSALIASKDWPVEHVSYPKAREFCELQGKRLPTEAEWEYATRAGSETEYPWGDTLNRDYLWYADNSLRTQHPVGTKKPNAWGVHDMLGSVWEWVVKFANGLLVGFGLKNLSIADDPKWIMRPGKLQLVAIKRTKSDIHSVFYFFIRFFKLLDDNLPGLIQDFSGIG